MRKFFATAAPALSFVAMPVVESAKGPHSNQGARLPLPRSASGKGSASERG